MEQEKISGDDTEKAFCEFDVIGEVVGKGRPRFSTRSGYPRAYTPQKTVDYENLVRVAYLERYKTMLFEKGALQMVIDAYFRVPASLSQAKQQRWVLLESPTKKPDADNILKSIADALNGIAYKDDSQITEVLVRKHWSFTDKAHIKISFK